MGMLGVKARGKTGRNYAYILIFPPYHHVPSFPARSRFSRFFPSTSDYTFGVVEVGLGGGVGSEVVKYRDSE